jgi:predicted DNA-binding protein YlxM (UPF0122 family)
MIELKIDIDKPWIDQLKRVEHDLIIRALKISKGNKAEASRLLGIGESTLKKRIGRSSNLKEVVKQSKPKPIKKPKNSVSSIVLYFLLGMSIEEIALKTKCAKSKIMDILRDRLGAEKCRLILNNNEQKREKTMMNTEEIIENNRLLLATIAESIRENKELSGENLVYAKILYTNGFINEKGEVTEEGKDALYH